MKTYTSNFGTEFTITNAYHSFAGYGHKIISVTINSDVFGELNFSATTNNMPDFDEASELEYGQEYFEALFELVQSKLIDEISEALL